MCVDFRLGEERSLRPVVDLRIHALHGKVRALHQAHLDLRSTLGATLRGELRQFPESIEGIRQVRLQHDARFHVAELFFVEQLGE